MLTAVVEIIKNTSKAEMLRRSTSQGDMNQQPGFFSQHFKDVSTGEVNKNQLPVRVLRFYRFGLGE